MHFLKTSLQPWTEIFFLPLVERGPEKEHQGIYLVMGRALEGSGRLVSPSCELSSIWQG